MFCETKIGIFESSKRTEDKHFPVLVLSTRIYTLLSLALLLSSACVYDFCLESIVRNLEPRIGSNWHAK